MPRTAGGTQQAARCAPQRPLRRAKAAAGVSLCAPEVARQVLLDLLLCGGLGRLGPQQRHHGHDKAGGAEAALRAVRLGQPLLHGVHAVAGVAHPFHRHHVHPLNCIEGAEAGVD